MNGDVTVLGAGVSGLSSALALTQAGYRVRMLAAKPPEQTTSSVAAACWYPFHLGNYDHQWAIDAHAHFLRMADDPASGVRMYPNKEYLTQRRTDEQLRTDFWWSNLPRMEFARLEPHEIPAGYADGIRFTAPVIRTPTYLPYLQNKLAQLGVTIHIQQIDLFEDLLPDAKLIVNCTGLGSADLCQDTTMYPAQGQIVVVQCDGINEVIAGTWDAQRPLYIIPRGPDIVLGGTFIIGGRNTTPDESAALDIRNRCEKLVPTLANAKLIASKAGLRPCRQAGPRLQIEQRGQQTIIHNYGHGGAGVTISWGCAQRVVELLQDLFSKK
jgi:D-amino-acid oxidase